MRAGVKERLERLESASFDWISRLPVIDYGILNDDYDDDEKWEEVHHDQTVTVYRNKDTDEVRGVYADRRTDDAEKCSGGARLEFL